MSLPVLWSATAVEQLEGIADHVGRVSPVYAARLLDRLISRTEQLADFPSLGRVSRRANDAGIRELVHGEYLIVYLLQPPRVDVLAVVSARQDLQWPAD